MRSEEMAKIILVCGSTGAGKTTYSISLAKEIDAVRFSIDPWMQRLYSKDMKPLDFEWLMERVSRCCEQIWEVSQQILLLRGNVVLDLGFTTKAQRELFRIKAEALGVKSELHYLNVPLDLRKDRVKQRNVSKDPELYAFEVTEMMFNFMEPRFETPDDTELKNGCTIAVK
jgi:predicted kinase